MTSTATGCPLEMCRKLGFLFCSWSASVFPTRHAVLKSTASCSFNLDRFRRSTFYRPSAVNCCRCRAQSVFSCIFLLFFFPVVRVASAVIQSLVSVMSLRTNSWVGNSNWPWKFHSVSCSWPPPTPSLLTLSVLHSEAQQSQPAVPLQTQLKQAALRYRRCCYFRTVSAFTPSTQTEPCGDPFSFPSNSWYQPHLNQAEPWPGADNHRLGLKDDLDISICLFFLLSLFPLLSASAVHLFSICVCFISLRLSTWEPWCVPLCFARQKRGSNCHQAVWGQRREMAVTPAQSSARGLKELFSRWLLPQKMC